MKPTKTNVDKLAAEFSKVLHEWLGSAKMAKIVKLNNTKYKGSNCCASHNYCDANQAILDGYKNAFGKECCYNASSERMTTLFNCAWNVARENNFDAVAIENIINKKYGLKRI